MSIRFEQHCLHQGHCTWDTQELGGPTTCTWMPEIYERHWKYGMLVNDPKPTKNYSLQTTVSNTYDDCKAEAGKNLTVVKLIFHLLTFYLRNTKQWLLKMIEQPPSLETKCT